MPDVGSRRVRVNEGGAGRGTGVCCRAARHARVPRKETGVTVSSRREPDPRAGQTVHAHAPCLEPILRKLKLLEFGLYGLQQYGRNAPVDIEDLGPFYRLAEEISGDLLAIQARLESLHTADG